MFFEILPQLQRSRIAQLFRLAVQPRGLIALAFLSSLTLGVGAARGQNLEWTRQLGTTEFDSSRGVSADGLGNVYISGVTYGSLGGPSAGNHDAWLAKYDLAGNILWTRQLGTDHIDMSEDVSADGLGNVYISGFTQGSLAGPEGYVDAFVSKYNAAGNLLWTRQLGGADRDWGYGVSADGLGNVYISGYTSDNLGGTHFGDRDAFVSKYNAAGTVQWTRQLGTPDIDESLAVSADGLGNAYISGVTRDSLGGPNAGGEDAFVSKYDAAGTLQWTRQLGTTSYDSGLGVSADGLGNVYISGYTQGSLAGPNAGSNDAWVAKFDTAGTLVWTRQIGTTRGDVSYGVSVDGLGNVYISGDTGGSLGDPNSRLGIGDAFVSKYNAAGTLLWTRQLGTTSHDSSTSVSADNLGNVYISGETSNSLGGPYAGGSSDAFVAKFSPSTPGDFDFDGDVDAADFIAWQMNFPKTSGATLAMGDADGDSDVDGADFVVWQTNFPHSPASPVPEPSAVVLSLIAAVGGWYAAARVRLAAT